MAFKSKDLSTLSYANGFTQWHYVTTDDFADVMGPGYFNDAAHMIRVGDLIVTNIEGPEHSDTALIADSAINEGVVFMTHPLS